jgi:gamma-glutamyltranspeptidase/glutathione hydrolase
MMRPDRPKRALLATGTQPETSAFAVSPHYLASQAGLDIMAAGGNAVDASIAMNAVLGVVLPETCGPGGDLFAMVHLPGREVPLALNASGVAGSGATADDIRDLGHGEIPYQSKWAITVPGCIDGWSALSERFGKMTLRECLAPAISTAREGFPASHELSVSLGRLSEVLRDQASATPLYPDGSPPAEGTILRRGRHADTLEAVASDGRAAFYSGDAGRAITAATDGAITPDDLASDQADWIEPTALGVFGRTAWTIPPNSQGYLTLAALWIFEYLDPPDEPGDPIFQHLLIEAYRSVAWERASHVSDPRTAPKTTDELLDPERLAHIASSISRTKVGRWPRPRPAPAGTAYMAARDSTGMAVSYIQSNFAGIGSRISAGDTGVFLHNRGASFNLIPGHPNEFTPGNRPMHTLAPTMWTSGSNLDLVLGTRGGDQQPQFLAQFAANHFHGRLCTDDSQLLPRWSMEQPMPGTDSSVTIEPRFNETTIRGLRDLGHVVEEGVAWNPDYGPISAIDLHDEFKASADPRVSTSAALVG